MFVISPLYKARLIHLNCNNFSLYVGEHATGATKKLERLPLKQLIYSKDLSEGGRVRKSTNIKLGWKYFQDTNTLAYFAEGSLTKGEIYIRLVLARTVLSCKWTTRESLLKGKDQYSWPPCTNQFRLASFLAVTMFFSFTKQPTLMRTSNVLSLFPSARGPWNNFPSKMILREQSQIRFQDGYLRTILRISYDHFYIRGVLSLLRCS